jgi:MFS family permease
MTQYPGPRASPDPSRLVQGLGAGIYFPAISATIQRQFSGDVRSRAFGYLGGAAAWLCSFGLPVTLAADAEA